MKGVYWLGDSGFPVADIDSSLFTHIFCAFADLDPTQNKVTIPAWNSAKFSTFTQILQQRNPNIKTLLSIGGGAARPQDFYSMAANPHSRQSFIRSSIAVARSYNFHGLDLDWEYPSTDDQMTAFSTLLTEWRAALERESHPFRSPLLLSAAVFRSSNYYGVQIPSSSLAQSLDWINVMSYDFYGPGWSATSTGAPANLFGPGGQVNTDAGITAWIQSGFPASKIAIGMPFYGWAWRLVNPGNRGFNAPANGAAVGPGISNDGAITYGGIRRFIATNRANPVYNEAIVSNNVSSGTTWIGYDDTESVAAKVYYARRKGLFGYFAWQVAADDNWTLSRTASNTWGPDN